MVNQVLETSRLPSSPAPCLCVSVAAPSSILRTLFQVPYPATPLFATLTKTAGVYTNNSHSGTHFAAPAPAITLKFFLFTFLRTLLHSPKTQLFYFQAIPHSLAKTPGGRGTPSLKL